MVSRKRDREYIGENLEDDGGYDGDSPFYETHSVEDGFNTDAPFPSTSYGGVMPTKHRRLLSSSTMSSSSMSSQSTVFPFLVPQASSQSQSLSAESLWSTIPPEWQTNNTATATTAGPATTTATIATTRKRSWSPDPDTLSSSEQSQTSTSVPSSDEIREGPTSIKRTRLLSSLSAMSLNKAKATTTTSSSTSTLTNPLSSSASSSAAGEAVASSMTSTAANATTTITTTTTNDAAVLTSKYLRVNHVGNTNETLASMNEYLHQLHLERQLRRTHPPLWSTGPPPSAISATSTSAVASFGAHRVSLPLPLATAVTTLSSVSSTQAMDEDPSSPTHEEPMDVAHDPHPHQHTHRHYRSASP